MLKICRFELPGKGLCAVPMPKGARIIAATGGLGGARVVAMADGLQPTVNRMFLVARTGSVVSDDQAARFVGSCSLNDGSMVHVFDLGENAFCGLPQ